MNRVCIEGRDRRVTASSGLYDRQLYALQTLWVPDQAAEKDHLCLTRNYEKKVVETFKIMLIESRETHVKQLGEFSAGVSLPAPDFDVHPEFPVEPFPIFYLRTARAYAFLSTLLQSVLGPAFMNQTKRLHEDGSRSGSLAIELEQKTSMLYGLHLATAASLGMRDQMTSQEKALFPDAATEASDFVATWAQNPDVAYDPRVIVPGAIDEAAGTVTYWAVVGVKPVQSLASFYPGFLPRDIVGKGFCNYRGITDRKRILYSFANVQVTTRRDLPPRTRAEFRAICDANKTEAAIVAAIQKR